MMSTFSNCESTKSRYFAPLLIGALWNIVFAGIGIFNQPLHISLFYYEMTPAAEYIANKTFWVSVLFAGLGYAIVAFAHNRFRFFISTGALGKIIFFLFVAHLWLISTATNFALVIAIGDILWAIYFLWFLFKTKQYGYI